MKKWGKVSGGRQTKETGHKLRGGGEGSGVGGLARTLGSSLNVNL